MSETGRRVKLTLTAHQVRVLWSYAHGVPHTDPNAVAWQAVERDCRRALAFQEQREQARTAPPSGDARPKEGT